MGKKEEGREVGREKATEALWTWSPGQKEDKAAAVQTAGEGGRDSSGSHGVGKGNWGPRGLMRGWQRGREAVLAVGAGEVAEVPGGT